MEVIFRQKKDLCKFSEVIAKHTTQLDENILFLNSPMIYKPIHRFDL